MFFTAKEKPMDPDYVSRVELEEALQSVRRQAVLEAQQGLERAREEAREEARRELLDETERSRTEQDSSRTELETGRLFVFLFFCFLFFIFYFFNLLDVTLVVCLLELLLIKQELEMTKQVRLPFFLSFFLRSLRLT